MWWENLLESITHGYDEHDYTSNILWECDLPTVWWNKEFKHVDQLRNEIYYKFTEIFSSQHMTKYEFELKKLADEILHQITYNLRADLLEE